VTAKEAVKNMEDRAVANDTQRSANREWLTHGRPASKIGENNRHFKDIIPTLHKVHAILALEHGQGQKSFVFVKSIALEHSH
jgi:hypothetical protein